jgi:transcriptional regulator of acetoin/glycerol metabolism
LRNVIRTALAICDGGVVRLRDLPSEVRERDADSSAPARDCAQPKSDEREQLLRTIRECDGNMTRAASQLGISRNTLYRRCRRLGIAEGRSRTDP